MLSNMLRLTQVAATMRRSLLFYAASMVSTEAPMGNVIDAAEGLPADVVTALEADCSR